MHDRDLAPLAPVADIEHKGGKDPGGAGGEKGAGGDEQLGDEEALKEEEVEAVEGGGGERGRDD